MRAIRLESGAQYKSWESKGFRVVKECIQKLAESLAYEVVQQGTQKVTRADAERWLQRTPTFLKMLEYVFLHLYHYRASTKNPQDEAIAIRRKSVVAESNKLLPFCEGRTIVANTMSSIRRPNLCTLLFRRSSVCSRLSSLHGYFTNAFHQFEFAKRLSHQVAFLVLIANTRRELFHVDGTNCGSGSQRYNHRGYQWSSVWRIRGQFMDVRTKIRWKQFSLSIHVAPENEMLPKHGIQ